VNPAVHGIWPAGDQPLGFHGLQVVGQGGRPDTDRFGQVALAGHAPGLQAEQHEPERHGAAGGGERFIEVPADSTRRVRKLQANRTHGVILTPSL